MTFSSQRYILLIITTVLKQMMTATEMYCPLKNMTVSQSNITNQIYQHMYTPYTSNISVKKHKGNSHPLSQPLKTADTQLCQTVNKVKLLQLLQTIQK